MILECLTSLALSGSSVHASVAGLYVERGVDIEAWQHSEQGSQNRLFTVGVQVEDRMFASWNWFRWQYDNGVDPNPYAGGWSYRGCTGPGLIKSGDGVTVIYFSTPTFAGLYGGSCDIDLNGIIDIFDIGRFVAAPCDWNLSGAIDQADFFDFLSAFFGSEGAVTQ